TCLAGSITFPTHCTEYRVEYSHMLCCFDLLASLGCGSVSLFNCISFAHVFALFGCAVKTRAFLVINVGLCVDRHQPMSAARCWRCGSSSRGGRRRAD